MRNKVLLILTLFIIFITTLNVNAAEFDILVLPADLFSVCDNYFCFPEVSEIVALDTISYLNNFKNIHARNLNEVRAQFYLNPELKKQTENMLLNYRNNDKVDFQTLKTISNEFGVKSIALISAYAVTDKAPLKRNLWDVLELSSAFKFTYPFQLKINAVLTDNVNNIIMWSGRFSKDVSNSNGYFSAINQTQAISQLEKIKEYSKNNTAQNISQNIHLRFFPKEVRTVFAKPEYVDKNPQFTPNALEKLSEPRLRRELEDQERHFDYSFGDDIFSF